VKSFIINKNLNNATLFVHLKYQQFSKSLGPGSTDRHSLQQEAHEEMHRIDALYDH